ncbi:CoF synthetase [Halomonas cerina]|uniref:Phenylacetate-CoA ligase n=1 Tax=Halomonas cerina TaxID=447424 RepID=A0A839VC78_9GAMM|nr:CoF synthetase [Halomonas cerina]MBB3190304.1 phenylacetate-CoA ligase [Halomonas cerina]
MFTRAREQAFWLVDRAKGARVEGHLDELAAVLGTTGDAQARIERRLAALLQHAAETTAFYADRAGAAELSTFPVVDKNVIRDHHDRFLSRCFDKTRLTSVVTSGSTGTPFKVYHSPDKRCRNTADTLFFAGQAGYRLGQRLLYLKVWPQCRRHLPVQHWLQNVVPVDVTRLGEAQLAGLVASLETGRGPHSLLGYVSALEQLCQFLDHTGRRRLDTEVASIITMSESPTPYVRERLAHYLGVPVHSRYSNLEMGILAQQVPGSGERYLVNRASYVVEILAMESDRPAAREERGRIVVTDLFNLAMPLIRYDTGDVGALSGETDPFGNPYLETVEGRRMDALYNTSGDLISSHVVYRNMGQYTEIRQYQVIQEGPRDYAFRLNMAGPFARESQLLEECRAYLGRDARFRVEYVDEIPLLASGKRKRVVNRWKSG